MREIGSILRRLREDKSISQVELAEIFSEMYKPVRSKTISQWENNDGTPNAYNLLCYLTYFGFAPFEMLTTEHPGRQLNETGTQRLVEYHNMLLESEKYSFSPEKQLATRMLRFYDLPVSAGTGQFLDGDQYEMREVDDSVPLDADYAVRIAGNSMEDRFIDKQWIYVREQSTLQDGEIGIFLYDSEAYCKVLGYEKGQPVLLSFNPEYAPIFVEMTDSFRVMGKVVG